MLIKAFLSHHSQDKEFVREVAQNLSRLHCIFDEQSFETGEEFETAIKSGLDESTLFVLFLGKETLTREYVQKEISLAKELYEKHLLNKVLVFIIDDSASKDGLPLWIKKIKYDINSDCNYVYRIIQNKVDELTPINQDRMIGRDLDSAEFEDEMSDNTRKKNLFFISGLEGIGKKTFSKHILKTKLSCLPPLYVEVHAGDGPLEMALNIMDYYFSDKISVEEAKKYESMSTSEKISFLIETLRKVYKTNESIVFCDKGGIFHSDGSVNDVMMETLNSISEERNLPIFFTTNRKPPSDLKFIHHHLRPLTQKATAILLRNLLPSIELPQEEMDKICLRLAGYPPAVHYGAHLINQYGLHTGILEKLKKSSFDIFSDFLNKLNMGDDDRKILSLLCMYSPLSSKMISKYLQKNEKDTFCQFAYLIDNSVIEIVNGHLYEISKPLQYSVSKLFDKYLSDIDHKLMRDILSDVIRSHPDLTEKLLFNRLLSRAKILLNEPDVESDMFIFISDILDIAEKKYHSKKYKDAIKYSSIVLEEDNSIPEAHEILIKSHIRGDNFDSAEKCLQEYRKVGRPQSILFLQGFLNRYQGKFLEAITSYKMALENGYRGAGIYREIAQCYILLENNVEALKYAEKAIEIQGNNIFILDIYANALARNGKVQSAKEYIDTMLHIQESDFTYQRAAVFELTYGDIHKAYEYLCKAIDSLKDKRNITFEMCVYAVLISTELNEIGFARQALSIINKKFAKKRKDIQDALLMRIYLLEGNIDGAKLLYKSIKESSNPTVINIITPYIERLSES